MPPDIETNRATLILRDESILTNAFVESDAVDVKNFNQIELGFSYTINPLAPAGARTVVKVQLSPDGENYFNHADNFDQTPPPPPVTQVRSQLLIREFEIYGKIGDTIRFWHFLSTAAQFIKISAKEENSAGNYGQLQVIARAAHV